MRDPKSLQSALYDTGKAVWNAGVGIVEGVPNLLSGAIPGAPDYVPFLDNYRGQYDTPAFGTTVEFLTGVGAFKVLGEMGSARPENGVTSNAIGESVSDASLPIGSKRLQFNQPEPPQYQPVRNQAGTVGDTSYSGHAFDRMQDRGLVPSVIENTIGVGTKTPSRGGTTVHYDPVNNVSVVTNRQGKVVTVKYGK